MLPLIATTDKKTYVDSPIGQLLTPIIALCAEILQQYKPKEKTHLTPDQEYAKKLITYIHSVCKDLAGYIHAEESNAVTRAAKQVTNLALLLKTGLAMRTFLTTGEQSIWVHLKEKLPQELQAELKKIQNTTLLKERIEPTLKQALQARVTSEIQSYAKKVTLHPNETLENIQAKILGLLELHENSLSSSDAQTVMEPILYRSITEAQLKEKLEIISQQIIPWRWVIVDTPTYQLTTLLGALFSQLPTHYEEIAPFMDSQRSHELFQKMEAQIEPLLPVGAQMGSVIDVIAIFAHNRMAFKNSETYADDPIAQDYQQQIQKWEAIKEQKIKQLSTEFNYAVSLPVIQEKPLSEQLSLIEESLAQWQKDLTKVHALQTKLAQDLTTDRFIVTDSPEHPLPMHYLTFEKAAQGDNVVIKSVPLRSAILVCATELQTQLGHTSEQLLMHIASWTIELSQIRKAWQDEQIKTARKKITQAQASINAINQAVTPIKTSLTAHTASVEEKIQALGSELHQIQAFLHELDALKKAIQHTAQLEEPAKTLDINQHLQTTLQKMCSPIEQQITELSLKLPQTIDNLCREKARYSRMQQQCLSQSTQALSVSSIEHNLTGYHTQLADVTRDITALNDQISINQSKLSKLIPVLAQSKAEKDAHEKSAKQRLQEHIKPYSSLEPANSLSLLPEWIKSKSTNEAAYQAYHQEIEKCLRANIALKETALAQDTTNYEDEIAKWQQIGIGLEFVEPSIDPVKQSITAKVSAVFTSGSKKKSDAYQTIEKFFPSSQITANEAETSVDSLQACLEALELDADFISRWRGYKAKQIKMFQREPKSIDYKKDCAVFKEQLRGKIHQHQVQQTHRAQTLEETRGLKENLEFMNSQKLPLDTLVQEIQEVRKGIKTNRNIHKTAKNLYEQQAQEYQNQLLPLTKEQELYQEKIRIGLQILSILPQIIALDEQTTSLEIPSFITVINNGDPTVFVFQERDHTQALQISTTINGVADQIKKIAQQIKDNEPLNQEFQSSHTELLQKITSHQDHFNEQLLESVQQSVEIIAASNTPVETTLSDIQKAYTLGPNSPTLSFAQSLEHIAMLHNTLQTLVKDNQVLVDLGQKINTFNHPPSDTAIITASHLKKQRIQQIIEISSQVTQHLTQQIQLETDKTMFFTPGKPISAESHLFYQTNNQAFTNLETNFLEKYTSSFINALSLKVSALPDTANLQQDLIRLETTINTAHKTLAEQRTVNEKLKGIIDSREAILDPLLQRLAAYLPHRKSNFKLKDTFFSKDKERRKQFVTILQDGITQYRNNGSNATLKTLIQYLENNIPLYPGQHLQPLLYEILYAVQHLDPARRPESLIPHSQLQGTSPVIDHSDAFLRLANVQNKQMPQASFLAAMTAINQQLSKMDSHLPGNPDYQNLITELRNVLDDFIYQTLDIKQNILTIPTNQQIKDFESRFRATLHHKDLLMQEHRHRSKQIAKHCFFGLVTLGIEPSVQLIHSKYTQGYASLLSTKRNTLINQLDHVVQDAIENWVAEQTISAHSQASTIF